MDFYQEMMSRNWAFISPEQQEKIKNTKILLAGCGLGSNIGVLAAQTGFTKFVVVDHDVVEISNLNRQAFDRRHLGQNKALALKKILEEKSTVVEVEAYPIRITLDNAEEFVSKTDVVVNTVDFNETVYTINDIARKQTKPVFFPMNMGWGGFCLIFTSKSATLEEILHERIINDNARFIAKLISRLEKFTLPNYLASRLGQLSTILNSKEKSMPQLAIASVHSASIVVESITKHVRDVPLMVAPQPIAIDLQEWR